MRSASRPPREAHAPADALQVAELVRAAGAAGTSLGVRGAGTWKEALSRIDATAAVDLRALSGVLEYTPDDLTISVGAATTIGELAHVTREHNQFCPLLPWGDDAGTVGATVATATAGPFATSLGRPRDVVIGLECVDGSGRIIRAGGKVVKNVAGFDLTRLMTGQWGTLGIITAVHLRLRARPVCDESFILRSPGPERTAAVQGDLRALTRGPYAPLGCVALDSGRWLLRFGGNQSFVRGAINAMRALGPCEEAPPSAWDAVRVSQAPPIGIDAWRWDDLSRRVKSRFDPCGVLNPCLLGTRSGKGVAA